MAFTDGDTVDNSEFKPIVPTAFLLATRIWQTGQDVISGGAV